MSEWLRLSDAERTDLWQRLVGAIETYAREVHTAPVAPRVSPEELRALLAAWDFEQPVAAPRVLDFAVENLWRHQVHTPHRRYFGLFNPAPTTMGIAADTLVAAFNPQLASWSHSPFAAEVEQHLIRTLAGRFGYDLGKAEGSFTSGGAESNHMAVAVALHRAFPEIGRRGLLALRSQPVLYVSPQAHHSVLKAARLCGLGTDAVREVGVDAAYRMRPGELAARIAADREDGLAPFLVVATAGTVGAGAVDPIPELAEVADSEGLMLHVDAAWGGAAVLLPELRPLLAGIERAGSISFDAHKWLSVPMSAGLFLTRIPGSLERTFRVTAAYMPAGQAAATDPYAHSMQWSRRFIGLKVFMSLAVAGWSGYESTLRHQVEMGAHLRRRLVEEGWVVVNDTPLPIVCFRRAGAAPVDLEALAADLVASGDAWISTVPLDGGQALRACITNYRTTREDVDALVAAAGQAWSRRARASGAPDRAGENTQ